MHVSDFSIASILDFYCIVKGVAKLSFNLIADSWIPVVDRSGAERVIAPWEMANSDFVRPNWPRADLNIACMELLIGLVFLADPPTDISDWRRRCRPDPVRFRQRLEAFCEGFNLLGDGPRFLQDLEPLDGAINPPDMLFIDSAGANTAKNNADLMVHRGRYVDLDLPTAAMALYAFQAHAPSGGAGNRTSMRGGGPLVTLIDPQDGLWALVWANVPYGAPSEIDELPWMRATRVSDSDLETMPPAGRAFSVEAFFGMPRRLRLSAHDNIVDGVIQKPWGTKYAIWQHPLTPYYRTKPGEVALPVHPRAGHFGYRHWRGILAAMRKDASPQGGPLAQRAACIETYESRSSEQARVIVAGWAMDNMKPRDFIYSEQPLVTLSDDNHAVLSGLIEAAENAAIALRGSLKPLLAEGEAREAEREAFYVATESKFLARLAELQAGATIPDVCSRWLRDLRQEATRRFSALALPGSDGRDLEAYEKIALAYRSLMGTFAGHGKFGQKMYEALLMDVPTRKGKTA